MSGFTETREDVIGSPGEARSRKALDLGLLLIRLAVGLPFVYHGLAIALGAFGGPGLHGFSAFTHMPLPVAALVGWGELLGGLGIMAGVLTRLAGAGLVLIMLGAVLLVHLHNGYDVSKGGMEYALALMLGSFGLALTGPGAYSALTLIGGRHAQKGQIS
jgi:putative oxidoreductase